MPVARPVRVGSPQAGPVYSGAALGILRRQAQTELKDNENVKGERGRFLSVEMFNRPPMAAALSGLDAEYAIVLIYSHEAGKREATLQFDVGQGTQDLGFRAEVPVLFNVLPARAVKLEVRDADGEATTVEAAAPAAARRRKQTVCMRSPGEHESRCFFAVNDELRCCEVCGMSEFSDCATPGQMARYEGVCCPRACGKCGGAKCFERPGGRAECCASEVLASNRSCANAEPPCVIDRTANARRRLPSWIAPQGLLRGVFRLTASPYQHHGLTGTKA